MSKELLKTSIMEASANPYNWSLYFFKIDRRSRNPYIVHKIRFRNSYVLQEYAKTLMETINKYQLEKLEKVQLYIGENSKIACDKISLQNELIKTDWEYLFADMAEATDMKIRGKYNGYILTGIPEDKEKSSLTMIKLANPVIEIKRQKNIIFHFNGEDELDLMADDICRLYMDTDIIIMQNWVYAFNLKVETLFNMDKTMQKIKERSIGQLLQTNAFSDEALFTEFAKSYTSPRTFVTLSRDRMQKLESSKRRKEVAELLRLKTDSRGKICLDSKEDVSLLIRYICFKIFKDYETKGLLEASNVTKVAR